MEEASLRDETWVWTEKMSDFLSDWLLRWSLSKLLENDIESLEGIHTCLERQDSSDSWLLTKRVVSLFFLKSLSPTSCLRLYLFHLQTLMSVSQTSSPVSFSGWTGLHFGLHGIKVNPRKDLTPDFSWLDSASDTFTSQHHHEFCQHLLHHNLHRFVYFSTTQFTGWCLFLCQNK